jgi:hypothetical protein
MGNFMAKLEYGKMGMTEPIETTSIENLCFILIVHSVGTCDLKFR